MIVLFQYKRTWTAADSCKPTQKSREVGQEKGSDDWNIDSVEIAADSNTVIGPCMGDTPVGL